MAMLSIKDILILVAAKEYILRYNSTIRWFLCIYVNTDSLYLVVESMFEVKLLLNHTVTPPVSRYTCYTTISFRGVFFYGSMFLSNLHIQSDEIVAITALVLAQWSFEKIFSSRQCGKYSHPVLV